MHGIEIVKDKSIHRKSANGIPGTMLVAGGSYLRRGLVRHSNASGVSINRLAGGEFSNGWQ